VRMAKLAHELLADIDKETVDLVANYDESEHEPAVLPARVPNLLINGSAGIAVGMATNIPPHNLREVINASLALLENPALTVDELIEHIPGPDFPTAGLINGVTGIGEAYRTGRGRVHIRARAHFEPFRDGSREAIVITELPYQVNKARLVEKIADLVREKKLEGISELRDESDKDGLRVVIELKRGENGEVVLNNLFKHTPLQTVFGINMVALVDGQPKLLALKDMLEAFLRHRREVVTRRTIFELRKARERAHVLEGLAVALANIDEVIALIKASPSPAEARAGLSGRAWAPGVVTGLLERAGADATRPAGLAAEIGPGEAGYRLSEAQAQAILELRLHRLTGLEQGKIINEYEEIIEKIKEFSEILESPDQLSSVIRDELIAVRDEFGDERRTEILRDHLDLSLEDLISEEDVIVTLSHGGYAKAQPVTDYQAQRRGGRGRAATRVKEEDFVDKLFIANTHDWLLCFSSRGKVYWLKVYELPIAGRGSRGKPIVNLLPLEAHERINAVLPVREFIEGPYVFMATSRGTVKKTPLIAFSRPRRDGIIAIDLRDDDYLIDVGITDGRQQIMLCASNGKAVRFREADVRAMGRTAGGVRGLRLAPEHHVIALIIADEGHLLLATEHGYGKLTPVEDFPVHGRGGQGVIGIQTNERNGRMVGALLVQEDDQVMMISSTGVLVRTTIEGIPVLSRNTQGVRLIRLDEGGRLVGMGRVAADQVEELDDAGAHEAGEEENGDEPDDALPDETE
jgi:DNA gyrase subunit A